MTTDVTKTFYKYLDHKGLVKTLENGTLRFSSPSLFNDPYDMQIDDFSKIEPTDHEEDYLKAVLNFFHRDEFPSVLDLSSTGHKMKKAYELIKESGDDKEALLVELTKSFREEFDVKGYVEKTRLGLDIAKKIFNTTGVLCGAKRADNLLLWAHYSGQHTGGVIKFKPHLESESILNLCREVVYSDHRPYFYRSLEDYVYKSLDSDSLKAEEFLNLIYYTKGTDWKYEEELRLCIPNLVKPNEIKYLSYHPEEIEEVYIGCRTSSGDREKIVSLSKKRNPLVRVYQMETNSKVYGLVPKLIT
jgi:hypothetical protein